MKRPWGLRLLGTPRLGREGRDEEPLERKAAALLAYLAIQGPTSRSTLAGLLWPHVVETRARNNLRQLLHRLRSYEGLLDSGTELLLGAATADVIELQDLYADGELALVAERWGAQAALLLEGHSYDDCPDLAEWVLAERERIVDLVRQALVAEAERLEAAGDIRSALVCAQQLSALDPLSEAGYRRLMRLHYLAGDRGQAMAAFRRCRQTLMDTFGLEPLPDTVELARAIDHGAAPRPEPVASRELPVTLLRPPQLVGRDAAWAALESAWDRVQTIVVVGEGGIGKTRLLRDFARSKGPFLMTRGIPGDQNVPYASKARSLGEMLRDRPDYTPAPWVRNELARILPDMFPAPLGQAPITDEPQKLRLFEAAASVMAHALEGNVALINDDLHLWDDASFEMGAYFTSRFIGFPAHALISFRPAEAPPERTRSVRRMVESGLAAIIELEPLGTDAIERLVEAAGVDGAAPPAETVERVSAGNPFYALEFLRSVWQAGRSLPGSADGSLPSSAAAVLHDRIQRLSGQAADLLRVRAMAAASFSLELAAAVLEVPLAAVHDAVHELERHRLLEHGELAHELLADAIESRTPPEASRLWHRRLAVQMEAFGVTPAAVATHYLAAWESAAAFPHVLRAGDAARAVFALDEATRWYRRALWSAQEDRSRADALLQLEAVATQQGRIDEAGAMLEEAERLARRIQDPSLLAEVALRWARWWMQRGDHVRATRLANDALADAVQLEDADRVDRARLTLGDVAYFAGDFETAQAHFQVVTESARDARRLRAFQRLGALEAMRGDVDVAFEHHKQALTLARRAQDLPLIATLLNSLGADRERRSDYEGAARYFQEAEEVAARTADRRTGAIALANASLTAANRGALGEALRHAGRALEMAAPLGTDRALAMASFVHGYALRRLGRFEEATTALEEAVRLRQAGSDVRGVLVARFNLEAIELERAATGATPTDAIDAILDELEALNIPQFCAWCHLELAFLVDRPGVAGRHIERALELDGGEHLRFAAEVAALHHAVLTGDREAIEQVRDGLATDVTGPARLETSLAYLLLAETAPNGDDRDALVELARTRVADEVSPLPDAVLEARLSYLQRRLPPA